MKLPKAILMDLDGTVYEGNSLIDGAAETIKFIRSNNIRLFFFTNNSEKPRMMISNKLNQMGIQCCEEDIISSGFIATLVVKKLKCKNVFVSGSDNLKQEFTNAEIDLSDEYHCDTLVIGMDSEYNYAKMAAAINAALRSKMIIACNKDRLFPIKSGVFHPGCGAMVSAIEFCSGKKTDIIVGKPNTPMFDYAQNIMKCAPDEIIVIGDTYTSDILMAKTSGAIPILVGSVNDDCMSIESIKKLPELLSKTIK